jgi:single-strand DNA-binding protein
MLNKATLIGRVGKKDTKTLKNGGQMTALSLATNRKYSDSSGEKQTVTTWHNVNCFSKLADIAEKYVHVGDLIYVEGEINNKKIEQGDKAGQWIYSLTANDIKFIGANSKKSDDSREKNTKESVQDFYDLDDSIPF